MSCYDIAMVIRGRSAKKCVSIGTSESWLLQASLGHYHGSFAILRS